MDRPLIVKSYKCKEGLSFDLSHEDVVEQLLPMFEKETCVIFDDDGGHKYLIPKDEYGAFEKCLSRIEDSFAEHKDEDVYYDELNDILDAFADKRLEGEEVFVVLSNDLIEGEED